MITLPSTSNQLIPAQPYEQQPAALSINDYAWSTNLATINDTVQHETMTQLQARQQQQQQLKSSSSTSTNQQGNREDRSFSYSDNTNWNIHADRTMNFAANHSINTHQALYNYDMLSRIPTNYQAVIQSRGNSPPQTTCYGIQDYISTGAATTTPTLCNSMEDGVSLADATSSSSCTSSVMEDGTYFSDGELGANSLFDQPSMPQLIGRAVQLEQEKLQTTTSASQNGTLDHDHDKTPPLQEDDQEQESHYCLWVNCQFESTTLDELIGHIRDTHVGSGKAAYHCEWSGCTRNRKPFMKRHKMHNHLRTHTGERPFQCTVEGCEKRFSRPDSLNTHTRTHSNIRPYKCPVNTCSKAYFHSRSLRKHVKGHEAAGIVVPRSSSRSSTSGKRNASSPKPVPSSPFSEQQQQDHNTIAPASTIVPSTTPPAPLLPLSSCSDSHFLLFNPSSSPCPDWDSAIIPPLPYTPAAPIFTNVQQFQPILSDQVSNFPTTTPSYLSEHATSTPMCFYNVPMTDPAATNYIDMPLKSSSNSGTPLYPNPTPCSLYDPLSLPYAYAPH